MSAAAGAALLATAPLARAQVTPSQTNSDQLNQLIVSDVFETTPNKNAAGEGYINGEFRYLDFGHDIKQYLYELKGDYGITDQITVGGWLPIYDAKVGDSHTGIGDITFFGQYKFDQLINPDVVNLTGQVDVVLPTGSRNRLRDTGKFGVRPIVEAYKNFGQVGPGTIGAYGLLGVTITTNPDVRIGLAGTYEWQKIVGIIEFDDLAGDKRGAPLVTLTPGVAYRGLNPFEFELGFPFGLNDASPDWGIVLKATFA
ncbi:MAG TPA: hypothetical protein VLI90_16605, partial [Tepidisphaeraceae bacterium]|nr:hypothetical protein [Tepidisphaeraceae bacterium]